ncbi:MAG TPA: YggT family protein [bacterium]|nr:YggT family protein [bacterium]
MFLIANLLSALARILGMVCDLAILVILVRVILSWANADPYNGLVRGVFALTEPLLSPFRRLVPPWKSGGLDLSTIFAVLGIELIQWFLVPSLYDMASRIH